MNNFQTIRQTAHETGLPEGMLRARLKRSKLPGFYAESRYYINVPLLMEMLDAESRASVAMDGGEAHE
ncbi:MAG: hypothetical protein MR552_05535 [Clostridiales bacterium]|mgnify:CR=1 FL=1|nr:hypothetical protein [Clostridiales bacterium]